MFYVEQINNKPVITLLMKEIRSVLCKPMKSPLDLAGSHVFRLSDPGIGNHRIRRPITSGRIPVPRIPAISGTDPVGSCRIPEEICRI